MKMNETEKNLEELEQVNGGDIRDAVNNYNMREEMKRDFYADRRRELQERLKRIMED